VKIHQKILIIIALAGILSAYINPIHNIDSQCQSSERQIHDAYVFNAPEPFSAALLEQNRVPVTAQKLPTNYFNQYHPIVALISLPLQLTSHNPLSLLFVSEGASFAYGDFHQNILFPFHFFG
jgi:hypothetical protein